MGPEEPWNWTEATRHCRRIAIRYVDGRDDAEDVAQEALLRAWRHRGSLRDVDGLTGWLASIVRNEAARQRGRRRPVLLSEPVVERGEDDQALLSVALRSDLQTAMARLEDRDRLLLRLRYGEDLTQAAIARLLKLPEGTVKVRLHRARIKLHRSLSQA